MEQLHYKVFLPPAVDFFVFVDRINGEIHEKRTGINSPSAYINTS